MWRGKRPSRRPVSVHGRNAWMLIAGNCRRRVRTSPVNKVQMFCVFEADKKDRWLEVLRSVVLGISLERKTGFELTLISRLRTRNQRECTRAF